MNRREYGGERHKIAIINHNLSVFPAYQYTACRCQNGFSAGESHVSGKKVTLYLTTT